MNCAYSKVEMHRQFLCVSSLPTEQCSVNHSPFEGLSHSFMGMGSKLLTLLMGLLGKNKRIVTGLCLLKYFWIFFFPNHD